jgi:hypothetical protein
MDMKDAFYIDRMLQREKEAGEKVKDDLQILHRHN